MMPVDQTFIKSVEEHRKQLVQRLWKFHPLAARRGVVGLAAVVNGPFEYKCGNHSVADNKAISWTAVRDVLAYDMPNRPASRTCVMVNDGVRAQLMPHGTIVLDAVATPLKQPWNWMAPRNLQLCKDSVIEHLATVNTVNMQMFDSAVWQKDRKEMPAPRSWFPQPMIGFPRTSLGTIYDDSTSMDRTRFVECRYCRRHVTEAQLKSMLNLDFPYEQLPDRLISYCPHCQLGRCNVKPQTWYYEDPDAANPEHRRGDFRWLPAGRYFPEAFRRRFTDAVRDLLVIRVPVNCIYNGYRSHTYKGVRAHLYRFDTGDGELTMVLPTDTRVFNLDVGDELHAGNAWASVVLTTPPAAWLKSSTSDRWRTLTDAGIPAVLLGPIQQAWFLGEGLEISDAAGGSIYWPADLVSGACRTHVSDMLKWDFGSCSAYQQPGLNAEQQSTFVFPPIEQSSTRLRIPIGDILIDARVLVEPAISHRAGVVRNSL